MLFKFGEDYVVIRDVVVIGASAGGVEALVQLCAEIPADFQGSVFVVLHTTATGESRLPQVLARAGGLTARHPGETTVIEPGTIYVAPPNRHMIVEDGVVRLTNGPRRDGHRPSINTLFESAAAAFGSRVIGIILSGSLDDGTLGLLHIKREGGKALVQSPEHAIFKGMPTSALEQVDVDFSGSIHDIGTALSELTGQPVAVDAGTIPERTDSHSRPTFGEHRDPLYVSGFTCPECGGVLEEKRAENFVYFRCHVGHEVSERTLLQSQGHKIETALWTALRILEERAALGNRLEQRAIANGNTHTVARVRVQNQQALNNAEIIRQMLEGANENQSITFLQEDVDSVSEGDERD